MPRIERLATVKKLAQLHPEHFPEQRTRDLIYHAEPRVSATGEPIPANGFAKCIVRFAGHVYIDLDVLPEVIEAGRMVPLERRDLLARLEQEGAS